MGPLESGLIGLVLVLGAIAVTLATGFLMLDNERLRWGNWELEGAPGRPPKTMEAWTQWVVVAGFLLPCAGVVVIPQLLALVRVAPAVAPWPRIPAQPQAFRSRFLSGRVNEPVWKPVCAEVRLRSTRQRCRADRKAVPNRPCRP